MEIVMSGIAKAFGTNQVLRDVSITLKEGEVHALMGENGAGKSTLMNILTGIHKADAGKITIDGVERTFPNPREAELNGVAFIHQELNIWPNLTLLENLYLIAAHNGSRPLLRRSPTDDGNPSYLNVRCQGCHHGRTDSSPHRA